MPEFIYTNRTKGIVAKRDTAEHIFRPEAAAIIEDGWKRLTERRAGLYNSTLLRVTGLEESDGAFMFNVAADVTYKQVTGLRYGEGLLPREIDAADSFNALSAYIFIVTADGKLVFIERDTGDWDKALDLPGGFIQEKFGITDISPFAAKRACDDMHLQESHIAEMKCLGAIKFDEILEMISIYKVTLTLSLAELKKIAGVAIYEMPEGYAADGHGSHFSLPLHFACIEAIRGFLDRVI